MSLTPNSPKNKRSITLVTSIVTDAKLAAQNRQLEEETQLEEDLRKARESAAEAIEHAQATKEVLQSSDSHPVITCGKPKNEDGSDKEKDSMSPLQRATAKLRDTLKRTVTGKKSRKK